MESSDVKADFVGFGTIPSTKPSFNGGFGRDSSFSPLARKAVKLASGDFSRNVGKVPFDITKLNNGDYISIWPATINGVLPSNMFTDFAVPISGLYYIVATATTNGSVVTGVVMSVSSSPPSTQTPATNAMPSTINIIVGLVNNGAGYNLAQGNVLLSRTQLTNVNGTYSGVWDISIN